MAYRYHPEIEGLKVNENGTEVIYLGEKLTPKTLKRTERESSMRYVYFLGRTHSVAKIVCECWNGLSENPRWYATRKIKADGFHYNNLFWAPCGTNPEAKKRKQHKNSKIAKEDIPVIEKRLKAGETLKAIASDYGTSDMSISRIKKRMNQK